MNGIPFGKIAILLFAVLLLNVYLYILPENWVYPIQVGVALSLCGWLRNLFDPHVDSGSSRF